MDTGECVWELSAPQSRPSGARQYWRRRGLAGAASLLLTLLIVGNVRADTSANVNSAIGVNLNGVTYYTPEQPFLNVFKTTSITAASVSGGWYTSSSTVNDTGEEAYVQLDANGYPTTLTASSADPNKPQKFTYLQTGVLVDLPQSNAGTGLTFRAGQYVVLYDGAGTLRYAGDAKLVSSSPGRDVLNVANPSTGGINIQITATTPGNYIRNIRVVYAAEESLLSSGQMLAPAFLQKLQNFRAARFMDWHQTNSNPETTWATRSQVADAGWGGPKGVPWEVIIAAANQAGVDAWVNVPAQADNDYITQMATLFHNTLNSSLHVYVEYSNETWNTFFPQTAYMTQMGKTTWPTAPSSSDFNRSYFGMRTAQIADTWKSVWGTDFSRVTIVLGAQAANPYTATQALASPLWSGGPASAHPIGAIAIAPYFGGNNVPLSWLQLPQATALTQLFTEINQGGLISGDYPGGSLKQVSDWEAAYIPVSKLYKLPVLAYEAGQTFTSFANWQTDGTSNGTSSEFLAFYTAANRDSRMGAAYTSYLNQWKANGGQLFMQFVDVSAPSMWGNWGALESFLDSTSPGPPKWAALQSFISSNPCWWAGCAGTIGPTGGGGGGTPTPKIPNPPSNVTVH